MTLPPHAVSHLQSLFGDMVVVDRDICASAMRDWTGLWQGYTPALLRPSSTPQVAALLSCVADMGAQVVIQGGNTSLTGGATPFGALVLSTSLLSGIDIDEVAGRATVAAGVTLGALAAALAGSGWELGVDLASRDSATVGGTIATNAGGLRVLRSGQMASRLLGVQAVDGAGHIISHLDPPERDNTGLRWPQLLAGSEGCLAVVTKASVKLVAVRPAATALCAYADRADAVAASLAARALIPNLCSAELMCKEGIALVADMAGLSPPLGALYDGYLLLEATDMDVDELVAAVMAANAHAGVVPVNATAVDMARRHELWRWREDHTLAIAAAGIARKCDLAVPPANAASLLAALPGAVARVCPQARLVCFGHIAEGSIHANILDGDSVAELEALRCAASFGGSISAEHGIGRQKRDHLALSRSLSELDLFERTRNAWDPSRVLNSGVLTSPRATM